MTTSTRTPSRTRHKSPESPVRLTPHAGFGGKLPGKDPGSCNMNTGLAGQLTLPNDAFSVAVAALRSPARRPVLAEDHAHQMPLIPYQGPVQQLTPAAAGPAFHDRIYPRRPDRRA